MTADFKKFILNSFFISLLCFGASYLLFAFCCNQYYFKALPLIPLYFFLIYALTHYLLLKKAEDKFGKFSAMFILMTGLKMILNIAIIVLYVFQDKTRAIPFLIVFICYYIIYTLFEVVSLLNYFKKKKNEPTVLVQ
ncbi:MAG: hypothetical protein A2275_11115 [Bacteroidetes bacterium RIFOXYA12_FULL_35_11]|nr:MAG: hypothetical protein A2X01_16155 [Bacteroidetes bacterium GWF2_35_48]OFY77362.1 MAG: hypothetical protein A2275_11115 [Bacteroidetes bacterium RIFOXYA12_FULL_35_11]OFY96191.1 MAG: hypothetical protein A2309_00995 [Bacteroidetes bacterium RIFOXYB2_FULL_35_7]OFZ02969.1 MAG: hypothetical protein A2491_17765 [Bacteroidetes bacterium RIFOXYC12_FULL_35_7]HBX50900.1 hypothetical protein [Bacteroidales bacterium]